MAISHKPGRDDAWEGEVVDKSRGMLDGANMYHFVEVRLTGGGTERFRVGRRLWKEVEAGDRIVKRPGADPVKE
ncbi:hypothetical protein [Streptomyces sp. VRA16 Mangrove soil]|uniref:DUF7489 domain-containing protein n=1 Tax=Streptomyces sp. VRA16 Mangrove soil TaxID=2817434 RepID=UPI001A9D6640|nr:hypothetical protein [Streptomyces sp. VRA16 Mangrove soil]MBO1332535.1 hypothetical protein [Streptomyces sp. VRA16 Mangrove soil]